MNSYALKVHLMDAETHEVVRTLTYSRPQLEALTAVVMGAITGANFEVLRLRYARPLERAVINRAWDCGCQLLKWHVEHCNRQGVSPTFEGRITDLGMVEVKASKFYASAYLIVNE